MKKIAALIFIFALIWTPSALAQDNAPRTRVEAMFKAFVPGQTEAAVRAFAKESLMPPELADQIASQVKTLLTAEKKILGFEFIQEQNVGQSIKRLTYVLKLSDQPLVWNFSFYKPANTWVPLRAGFVHE